MKLILLFFVGVALFQLGVAEEKLDFIMVMKSGCPPCKRFITKALYPNVGKYLNHINLKLWPKGYSDVDKMIACLDQDVNIQLAFYNCFANRNETDSCLDDFGIDKEGIKYCMVDRANEVIANNNRNIIKYGIVGVPAIILNSTFSASHKLKFRADFNGAMCEFLNYPADVCEAKPTTTTTAATKTTPTPKPTKKAVKKSNKISRESTLRAIKRTKRQITSINLMKQSLGLKKMFIKAGKPKIPSIKLMKQSVGLKKMFIKAGKPKISLMKLLK